MNNRIRIFALIIIVLTAFSFIPGDVDAESNNKLIVVSSDTIDISDLDEFTQNFSAGLLNLKSTNRVPENIYINMAYGRTFGYSGHNFSSVEYGNTPYGKGFSKIMNSLENEYSETNEDVNILGDILKKKGIKRAYLGSSDLDYILLSDSSGRYDFGEKLKESDVKDIKNIVEYLDKADIILLSLKGYDKSVQKEVVEKILRSDEDMMLISTKTFDFEYRQNKSLSIIMYKKSGGERGILSSDSTKRDGVVSSLDIKSTVLERYNMKDENSAGKTIFAKAEDGHIGIKLEDKLESFLNLNITKYIFHGILIAIDLAAVFFFFFKREKYNSFSLYTLLPCLFVFSSIIYSVTSKNFFVYIALVVLTSMALLIAHKSRKFNILIIPVATNIVIIIGIILFKNMIYDSFIGYNNIAAGGRYYGFNNDIMGVLLASGIATAVIIGEKRDTLIGRIVGLLILLVNFIALTGNYGSNFGGLMTSVVAIVIYSYIYFPKTKDKRINKVISFTAIAVITMLFFYIGGKNSHISEFFERIISLGMVEFVDMVKKKLSQLIYMTIVPPWSVILVAQSVFIINYLRKNWKNDRIIKLIFATSIAAVLLNDTGAIAFAYMNAYSIAIIRYLGERGYLLNEKKED